MTKKICAKADISERRWNVRSQASKGALRSPSDRPLEGTSLQTLVGSRGRSAASPSGGERSVGRCPPATPQTSSAGSRKCNTEPRFRQPETAFYALSLIYTGSVYVRVHWNLKWPSSDINLVLSSHNRRAIILTNTGDVTACKKTILN
jgi:hypothetical protein